MLFIQIKMMCLQLYFIFLLRSPTSSQPSLSFNDFVLVLCGRWFIFFQLFHISVEIHIFITIIINYYGLFVILQFYLIFLLWSISSSPSSWTLADVCKSIGMFCCDPYHFQYLADSYFHHHHQNSRPIPCLIRILIYFCSLCICIALVFVVLYFISIKTVCLQ